MKTQKKNKQEKCDMIKLDEALKEQIKPEDLKDIIESDNIEKKFKLAIQIIFSTDKADFGWNLLNSLDVTSIVDENFLVDLFINKNLRISSLSSTQIVKFINFLVRIYSRKSPNMAIQKHLASYSPEKPQDNGTFNIEKILEIIELFEQKQLTIPTERQYDVCLVFIRQIARIQLPREPNDIKLFQAHTLKIAEYFRKVTISNEDRLRFLELLYSELTKSGSSTPAPLMAIGFLVIPDSMITQAIEYFFKTLEWNGRKTEQSIVTSIKTLISWLRASMPVPLDLWIVKTISVLSSNGFNELVDSIGRENVKEATLTLLFPAFQTKTLPVIQAIFEYARNTKELLDIILPRLLNLLKTMEVNKCEALDAFIELICDTLGSIDHNEEKYKELIDFLASKNRSPSKSSVKKLIGPTSLKFLSNNARVGLENLGNTCYLNSVLQALFMTKQFCREILTTQRSDRTLIAIQKLFALMLFSPRPEQNPQFVVNLIRPDDFLPGIQHDSSEFLGSILDRLHELEKKMIKDEEDWDNDDAFKNASLVKKETDFDEVPMDIEVELDSKGDKMDEPKDKIVDNTSNLCQTYIQKIFGGKIATRYLCSTCKGNSMNIDSFRDLQLSFPEKIENEACEVQYNVQQLLEFYFSPEELNLDGDNQYHCDNCKILCNGIRCTEILEPPRNLILTLKHFRYDSRHHIRSKLLYKVFHDEIISVNVKGSFNPNSTRNVDYKLYAAVIHSGTSLDSGHYYTIARESENKWFKFNDSYVTNSSLEELRSLISPNTPYILFYQRLSTASSTAVHPESASTSTSSMLPNQMNEQNFPEYHELPTYLKDLIDEDKTKFESETMLEQNSKMTYRVPVRDNFDDNNDPGSGSFGINDSFAHNRFIY